MLNRKVGNFTLSAITIVSAIALTALSAPGASAAVTAAGSGHVAVAANTAVLAAPAAGNTNATPDTSLPKCYTHGTLIPWTCVQVFGTGLYISLVNGWTYNPPKSIYTGQSVHIELYYANSNRAPGRGTSLIKNCNEFNIPQPGHNSGNCSWQPARNEPQGYYCAALWWFENLPPNIWNLLGWSCVDVHP